VLCYELLTGRRPFDGALSEMMYKICHVPPAAVTTLRPTIPAALDPIIARALAKEPAARYQTAGDFHAALESVRVRPFAGAVQARPPATQVAAQNLLGHAASGASPADVTVPVKPAQTDVPPGWSHADLDGVARQLAPILGPMAKITVKRAAAQTQDRAQLYALLSRELHTDEERERFKAAAPRTAPQTNPPAGASRPIDSQPAVGNEMIAPATLERAAKILARYIGPIAAVIVKKAAAAAVDESDLYARLAERISDARERAQCVGELRGGG
jgi:serine/threonine-protein kinase